MTRGAHNWYADVNEEQIPISSPVALRVSGQGAVPQDDVASRTAVIRHRDTLHLEGARTQHPRGHENIQFRNGSLMRIISDEASGDDGGGPTHR
ncbi:hypothetical protein EYF80_051763 [Liparis tanakae]|uniref:Uncharacterized protein n=1 Tax=Liparis tanakae TaxID=230148 RepID=A0A4Z2FAW3_9TELE|nr:hypothetical protein EYF80_051763 [Liparis tanakae]